jgi:hypothetical protein
LELVFVDGMDMELTAGTEIEFPSYVTKLPPDELKEAQASDDRSNRVIAAGTDPRDQKITLVTATGKIMIFDAARFHIPAGPSMPSHCGQKIFLPNVERRWYSPSKGFYVDAAWVLKNSESGLTGAVLSTNNYPSEDKTK